MADLTAVDHWDQTWDSEVRLRLPSPWIVPTRDLQRLLRRHVRAGDRILEVGCAPGKLLAWSAAVLRARASGLDYSTRGVQQATRLFDALQLTIDLRNEDLRETTFPRGTFDLVFSIGVIEHFDDPRGIVEEHLSLVRPGGTALMTVPNYRGLYGAMQRYFDPDSLLYHNLDIMTCDALVGLIRAELRQRARSYPFGRFSPWLLSTSKRWPRPLAHGLSYAFNAAALLQPVDIPLLCPMLVLEVTKPLDST